MADSRILRVLLEAREALRARSDSRPVWTGIVCPACGMDYRAVTAVDGVERSKPVMPRSQTTKASSAESILQHCLKRLGFTRRWREGRLTNRQILKLLEKIRLYGRAWLRHEAEELARSHLEAFQANRVPGAEPKRVRASMEGVSR